MSDAATRQQLRERFDYRCGYCGTHEIEHGSLLEIDHFRPRTQGGSDRLDNLVYACTACNRAKAAYWPATTAPPHRKLLHPLEDTLADHARLGEDGQLTPTTQRGEFHVMWLRLNRPQLVAARRQRQQLQRAQQKQQELEALVAQLLAQYEQQIERIAELQQLLDKLRQEK